MLILLGLVQSSKNDNAMGGSLGSSKVGKVAGVRQTMSVLEKMTVFFTGMMFICSVLSYKSLTNSRRSSLALKNIKSSTNEENRESENGNESKSAEDNKINEDGENENEIESESVEKNTKI